MPKFNVTIHKQMMSIVQIEDAKDADDAIAQAHQGNGQVLSLSTISAQYIPQQIQDPQ